MEKEKLIIRILKGLNEQNKMPEREELNISLEEYGDAIETILKEELISGGKVIRGGRGHKVQYLDLDKYKININGINYLKKYSIY